MAWREDLLPAVRLNGTSDIAWERVAPELFEAFQDVQFYDYTKSELRAVKSTVRAEGWPSNYDLTFSRSEINALACGRVLEAGGRVAVVFRQVPSTLENWQGWPCVNGDKSDLRFKDPKGCVVALRAKGGAKKDKSGFVVDLWHGGQGFKPCSSSIWYW
jgi:hypothetical protein